MDNGTTGIAAILFGIAIILFGGTVVSGSPITAGASVVGVVVAALGFFQALRAKAR